MCKLHIYICHLNIALMRKHHRIILNYYLKYMSGFDAQMLRNVVMVSFPTILCNI